MKTVENERNVKVRTGQLDDAESILRIQREVISENDFLISEPEEFTNTVEQQIDWLKNIIANDRETIIVAEINSKGIGWIVFQSHTRKRLSHTGSFGVMIDKEYRGLGMGKLLIHALQEWAEKNPLIEKVSLGVFSTNHRAIALYKSLGFVEEGRKVNEIKMNDNEYVDDVLMYKLV
ncbi:GNAT family N-acetyltransferase [Bacillus sp. Bva_UNVM-123]|uniref:N-acetyltransferase family protein n=1 Tax=Bacillus sp. Bva_UNVM-123 TaxID=2829798 RepID=UPI00391F46A8